jgi:hypothetical protein
MTPRPTIFISAVSRELKSARQLVSNTLQFLGYEPVWQDIFGTEQGDLRAMLRQKIDGCKGVVQLVGNCYGAEPPAPDEQFGRVSYTQYEALYAKQRGKKVWYLFLDDDFPGDAHEAEAEELRELQATYRRRLKSESQLYHPLSSREALETSVLKLRDDLTRLRRGVKQWAFGVAALLILLTVLVVWLLHGQQKQTKIIQKQGEQVNTLVERNQKMEQALEKLAEVESHERQPGEKLSPEEQRARAYAALEKDLGLEAGSLARELPALALELYNRSDTTPLLRAKAAYALNKFDEAEKLSVEAANQDVQAYEKAKHVADDRRKKAIEDFELAGQSAEKRIQYADALNYYRQAEQLTDRARDPLEWAGQQCHIAKVLEEQGSYAEAEKTWRNALEEYQRAFGAEDKDVLRIRNNLAITLGDQGKYAEQEAEDREVLKLREKVLGPEHPDMLGTRNNLAVALSNQGKYAEAEAADRAVIKLEEKVLGPEHPETLASRNNLADTLLHQGKYAGAEAEDREVLKLREKVLGPEHPDTLGSRNNLAAVLLDQGKYAEAETEYLAVIKLEEKVLGPEHPDTLNSRNNLAVVLCDQGKYAEAESEHRKVFKLREKALGPENPATLTSRMGLGTALLCQGKYAEAETELRAVIKLREKVLGPEHPATLGSRDNLAIALHEQGKYAEAETELRAAIKLKEKVLGPEHPHTLGSCYNLAICLKAENNMDEAKMFAQRAADGATKVLGANHPDTLKYEKLWQELQTTNSPTRP